MLPQVLRLFRRKPFRQRVNKAMASALGLLLHLPLDALRYIERLGVSGPAQAGTLVVLDAVSSLAVPCASFGDARHATSSFLLSVEPPRGLDAEVGGQFVGLVQ
ncbi:MAG TPA: hypothetical protein P5532_16315, partial [Planctomycetota bacterium]|nr:hypothetical protein [Planctomycetota bacterium]